MSKNCALLYTRKNVTHSFTAAGTGYSYGFAMVAEESATRRTRAYYPHRVAPTQFTVTMALRANTEIDNRNRPVAGTSEYDRFGQFIAGYYNYMLEIGQGVDVQGSRYAGMMQVRMAGRGWSRFGIPVTGATFGDHIGSMLYSVTLTFETAIDPFDAATNFTESYYDDSAATLNDRINTSSFYPWSEYSTGTKDQGLYDVLQTLDYRITGTDSPSLVDTAQGGGHALPTATAPSVGNDPSTTGGSNAARAVAGATTIDTWNP